VPSIRRIVTRRVQELKEYSDIADIGEIVRRYFAMNAFDGVLTIIGVLMGNYVARVQEPSIVISTGLSTCIAMGVSGLWGAYLTESAERKRDLDDLQNHTLTNLSQTKIGRAGRIAVVAVALVDGLAPFLGALVVLAPFFLATFMADVMISYYVSLGIALAALFGLGAFLGKVSRGSVAAFGVKMITAGFVSIVLSYLLEKA
jgi:predicted membrane protein (TIGR00267 family)